MRTPCWLVEKKPYQYVEQISYTDRIVPSLKDSGVFFKRYVDHDGYSND